MVNVLILVGEYEFIGLYVAENWIESDNSELLHNAILYNGYVCAILNVENLDELTQRLNHYNISPSVTDPHDYLTDFYDVYRIFDAHHIGLINGTQIRALEESGILNDLTKEQVKSTDNKFNEVYQDSNLWND